jgi:hypothetical protein
MSYFFSVLPIRLATLAVAALVCSLNVINAQSVGNFGSVNGTVLDSTGAVVPNAKVEIRNPVSGFDRSTTTDTSGRFEFTNVPFNPYHLTVTAEGFASYAQDVEPRSSVPVTIPVKLQVAGSMTSVTVEANGGDLVETDPTFHTDVDKNLFDKLPLESQSSSVSSLVTLSTPGISADSNGLFHGLGDHAENSFSVDGQPITDQQSKVFSNQIPLDATTGRIRRQDQRRHQRDHSIGTGCYHSAWSCNRVLRFVWHLECGFQSRLWRQELGQFYFRQWIE